MPLYLQIMTGLVFSFVVLLISIPTHEFCHFIAVKMVKSKTKLFVKWFEIKLGKNWKLGGCVRPLDGSNILHLTPFFIKRFRLTTLFIGLSGGVGCALVLYTILTFMGFFLNIPIYIKLPFFIIIVFSVNYGLKEGCRVSKNTEIVDGEHIQISS